MNRMTAITALSSAIGLAVAFRPIACRIGRNAPDRQGQYGAHGERPSREMSTASMPCPNDCAEGAHSCAQVRQQRRAIPSHLYFCRAAIAARSRAARPQRARTVALNRRPHPTRANRLRPFVLPRGAPKRRSASPATTPALPQ